MDALLEHLENQRISAVFCMVLSRSVTDRGGKKASKKYIDFPIVQSPCKI